MKKLQSFLKRPFKRGNERGIALVFTLGILGLLIVIALAFSSSAITERKAAYNNDARSLARILAQSGLNRAMAAMMYYSTVSDSFDKLYSHDATTNTVDYIYKLSTTIDGDSISVNGMSDLQWQYVYNGKGTSATNDADYSRIIGRYSYVVVPSGGYLDPSEVVDSGSGTLLNETSASRERPGVNISEIYVPGLTDNTSDLSNAEISNLSDSSASGLKSHNGRWADMDTLFSTLGITDITKKQKWGSWFAKPSAEDKEVYWIDANDNGKLDDSSSNHELFKRFNLSRTDWDTMTIADILADKVYYTDSGTPGIQWIRNFGINDSGADDSTYIGTFSTIQKRRCQIAANLLDYCKSFSQQVTNGKVSGSYPTVTASSILPSAWSSSNFPDFTGNKKTYYLNELGLKIALTSAIVQKVDSYDGSGNPATWHWECQLDLQVLPGAEIINLYGTSCNNATSNVQILLDGATVSWTPALSDGTATVSYSGSPSLPTTITSTITAFSSGTASVSYFPSVASNFWAGSSSLLNSATATTSTGTATAPTWSINTLSVSIPCMILQYDGSSSKRYDCSNLTGASGTTIVSSSTGITSNNTDYYYVSYEAIDPRQNLNSGDWYVPSAFTKGTASTPTTYTGTPAAVNTKSSPASCYKSTTDYGSDTETATSPTGSSTNYIREAPMQSPWELGFIHRGAAWETINLRQYNTNRKNGLNEYAGGARYSNTSSSTTDGGDANILDEIKMSDLDRMYGKVNVKTANNDVLKALFFYVKYGTSPLEYSSGSQVYTTFTGQLGSSNNYHDGFATAVRSYVATKGIKTRAMLANASGMTSDYSGYGLSLSRSAKAGQEEILGKTVNLMKVEAADTFSMVVLAQAIRDAGSYNGIPISKDLNGNGSIESSVSVPNVDSGSTPGSSVARTGVNETRTCKLGTYDFGFDEILAEQKIYAVFRKTTAGKWRIVRYEYVDPGSDSWTTP